MSNEELLNQLSKSAKEFTHKITLQEFIEKADKLFIEIDKEIDKELKEKYKTSNDIWIK